MPSCLRLQIEIAYGNLKRTSEVGPAICILEALDMRVKENNLVLTVGMWLQDEEYEDDGKAHEYYKASKRDGERQRRMYRWRSLQPNHESKGENFNGTPEREAPCALLAVNDHPFSPLTHRLIQIHLALNFSSPSLWVARQKLKITSPRVSP